MALYATHLRFARDLILFLAIEDFSAYYSGVTYPDSRNLTKTARTVTHKEEKNFNNILKADLNDFEKGLAVHDLYDTLAWKNYVNLSPWPSESFLAPGRVWCFATAEKVIEDWLAIENLGDDFSLIMKQVVCPSASPNGEDYQLLQNFYSLISEVYSQRPGLDNYKKIFLNCGASAKTADDILVFVEQINQSETKVLQIKNIYDTVLKLIISK